MLKFDERFENIEHYLYNVYLSLTSRFVDVSRDNSKTTNGLTWEEIKDVCPELYAAFKDVTNFLEYTEKFLGYKYDNNIHYFKYMGE